MQTATTHPSDISLQALCTYKNQYSVTVFGRERDLETGKVEYYWVLDNAGRRFKAWPNELKVL